MQLNYIVKPLIGAFIGYVTNDIAVKMLFRPLKPIYIGKFHVPFTPGIIPKGQDRLAKAIGAAVGNSLLTPEVLKETLLSENVKKEIEKQMDIMLQNLSTDESTVDSRLQPVLNEIAVDSIDDKIVNVLTEKLGSGLTSMNIGDIVANEVFAAVQSKAKGTLFSMLVKPSILAPITDEIKIRSNKYIEDHGAEKIGDYIKEEFTNFKEQSVSSLFINKNTDKLKEVILSLYTMMVNNYAEKFLSSLNLSKIVEEKISAMDTKDVEDLVLSIMNKELKAIVNLGAVIGFILGLLELFF
jgi:uncharacterized membrane protein YheB (UPF0754 family)